MDTPVAELRIRPAATFNFLQTSECMDFNVHQLSVARRLAAASEWVSCRGDIYSFT